MNKEKFVEKLESVTGLDREKCNTINSILENNFIIGKKGKEKIVQDICEKLSVTSLEAEKIYESSMSIVGTGIKEKLKHPFKSQEDR